MQQPANDLRKISAIKSQQIEDEHARLWQFLLDLRETCCKFESLEDCQVCEREKIASCQGRLFSFGQDFLDLVATHFENEEEIMEAVSRTPESNEHFRLHQKEHANLLKEMEALMHQVLSLSRESHTSQAIREFHAKTTEYFYAHGQTFDVHFVHRPKSGKE